MTVISMVTVSMATLGCLDATGSPTEWWMAIKKPDSYDYALFTGSAWTYSGSLEDKSGPLYETLDQIYGASTPPGYVMYNDHPPDINTTNDSTSTGSENWYNGHMKGVLAFNTGGGFWLIHSAPRFPGDISGGYSYPYDETEFGQNFFCISLSPSAIEGIATNLLMTESPNVYLYNFPDSTKSLYPNLVQVSQNVTNSLMTKQYVFQGTSGTSVTGFGASGHWDQDLYEDLVAPGLQSGLYTETWQQGSDDLPSYCTPQYDYDVTDIKTITVSSSFTFSSYDDHSKWVISLASGTDWVCFGDKNRETSQRLRGGGTYCLNNAALYSATMKIIASVTKCT